MQQIEATIQFARERGDFRHPVVQQVRSQAPNWICALGTDAGTASFNSEFQTELPVALRYYFRDPDIASLIHAGCDLDVYLDNSTQFYWLGTPVRHLPSTPSTYSGRISQPQRRCCCR